MQTMQNKYIRFCLRLNKTQHMPLADFRPVNWLPTEERAQQCIYAMTFKLFNKNCPFNLNQIFGFARRCRIDTKKVLLKHPICKTDTGNKTLSYIGPSFYKNLPKTIKKIII